MLMMYWTPTYQTENTEWIPKRDRENTWDVWMGFGKRYFLIEFTERFFSGYAKGIRS